MRVQLATVHYVPDFSLSVSTDVSHHPKLLPTAAASQLALLYWQPFAPSAVAQPPS